MYIIQSNEVQKYEGWGCNSATQNKHSVYSTFYVITEKNRKHLTVTPLDKMFFVGTKSCF